MIFSDDFWRAFADYMVIFPTVESLGAGTPPTLWAAEYAKVRKPAFDPVLLTATATEGANGSGQRNFAQTTRADALHCRRHDLDRSYELPPHLAGFLTAKAQRANPSPRRSRTIRFCP